MKYDTIFKWIEQEIAIWQVGALPGIVVLGFIIVARFLGLLQSLEWSTLDRFLRLRPTEPIDERILIVAIDEADIKSVGAYPIPDREVASLLGTLQIYKPRAIGLDLFRDLPVEPGHTELVAEFKKSKNIIAIEKTLPDSIPPPPALPPEQIGFSDTILDTDGKLRRILLGTPTSKGYKFSFALRLAKVYLAAEGKNLENGKNDTQAMRFASIEIPRFFPNTGGYVRADAGGIQMLLNFRNSQEPFQMVSLNDIKTKKFHPSWIQDRLILIGITSPGVDLKNTSAISTSIPGIVYGVEIQAHVTSQIISAVLDGRALLTTWLEGWEYLWIILWGFLGIGLGRLTQSPWKNLLSVIIANASLAGISYLLLISGLWVPVVPTMLVLALNGIGLTAFYQYDRALRTRINERQFILDSTFDAIHNGPLQRLAKVLREMREPELPSNQQLLSELEDLNRELRTVYESIRRETLTQTDSLCLGSGLELDLQTPMNEILYHVYSTTLERDFPCFKTLKVKVCTFDPFDVKHLSTEQKRGLCRFLEEALCNVGKHAKGVTRLNVTYTQKDSCYILRVVDNGQGSNSYSEGRGTQQCQNLARQLKGQFRRLPASPKGTLCELTWPERKRTLFPSKFFKR